MKKITITLAIALSSYCSYAQFITNSGNTTTSDKVGIGTTSLYAPLSVDLNSPSTGLPIFHITNSQLGNGQNSYFLLGKGISANNSFIFEYDHNSTADTRRFQLYAYESGGSQFTLMANGNVGIGTKNPVYKWAVSNAGANGFEVDPVAAGGMQTNLLSFNRITSAYTPLTISASRISFLQGSVGIGTTNPNALLDVLGGNVAVSNNLNVGGDDGNGLKLFGNTSNPPYRSVDIVPFIPASAPGVDHVGLKIYTANGITSRVNAMTVTDAGNVIIGNASQINSAYKLDVYGNARANEIVVNTTGADFVFDKKYSLPKLSDIKAYINDNHHLPEIPSAKEMQTNGVELGQLNTKLLQKVEELTLYAIQQKEENELLKKENKLLEARMATMEVALSKLTGK